MQDKILGFYLVFPFAIAVIVFANVFIKKSYTAELISGIFSIINFGFASYFLTIYTGEKYFSDNISFVFLFIFSLVFMFLNTTLKP